MITGRQFWLWRALDDEGEVLDLLVQRRRDKTAAVKLMRKLLKKHNTFNVQRAFSRYRSEDAKRDCCAELQAAAATSRHVALAAARSTRCVWAAMMHR